MVTAGLEAAVVIPTFRRPRTVLRVVEKTIEQLSPRDQLVVVDDGSEDETVDRLAGLSDRRLTVITQANAGVGAARNLGARTADRDLLVFLDDDEVPLPGWLDAHRSAHRAGGRRAAVGRSVLRVRSGGTMRDIPPPDRADGPLERLVSDSFSVRSDDFESVGGFDERFRHGGEDVELGIRLQQKGVSLWLRADALVWHEIDRPYREFRRQRIRRGQASALLRRSHGVGLFPDPGSLTGPGRLLGLASTAGPAVTEPLSVLLWGGVLAARRLGRWRVQAAAAGRVTLLLGMAAERAALRSPQD